MPENKLYPPEGLHPPVHLTLSDLREALELGRDSRVLMFSTEGDTDPDKYREIVWGGAYPTV